jgi:hypothetical protein
MTWQGNQTDVGYGAVIMETEFAKLAGGDYTRVTAGYQYNFNYMPIPFTGCRKYYTISISGQGGWIARPGTTFTGVINFDLSVSAKDVWRKLPEWMRFAILNEWTWRSDLENPEMRYSLKGGVEFNLPF